MNITELRYLVAIMKWGSVSAAAKQLYAAQPNVSKALKNLEEEYGVRIFERSSTGMIPTEQGKRFIAQAQRVLQQVDELKQEAHQQRSCAELRVVLTHATYASYAAVDFLQQAARSEQLRAHIRESGAIEALDFVLRQGYHMALLRYAAEDEDYYLRYCQRHGLRQEPIMEFSYLLLTSQDSPLAQRQGGEPQPPHPCVRAVQPVLHFAEPAHGLYVVVPHAAARAGTVSSGAAQLPGAKAADAGRAGVPGAGTPAAGGAAVCAAAAQAGRCHHQGQRVEEDLKCAPRVLCAYLAEELFYRNFQK